MNTKQTQIQIHKYLLCPGYNDNGKYFNLSDILKLYNIDPKLCLIPGAFGSDNKNLTKLTPK